jgi:hypothetical protein
MTDPHARDSGDDHIARFTFGETMKTILFGFVAAALLLNSHLAHAHHGWAAFLSEPGSDITLKGTVKEFHFVNPHSVFELEVKDEKGQVQVWEGRTDK